MGTVSRSGEGQCAASPAVLASAGACATSGDDVIRSRISPIVGMGGKLDYIRAIVIFDFVAAVIGGEVTAAIGGVAASDSNGFAAHRFFTCGHADFFAATQCVQGNRLSVSQVKIACCATALFIYSTIFCATVPVVCYARGSANGYVIITDIHTLGIVAGDGSTGHKKSTGIIAYMHAAFGVAGNRAISHVKRAAGQINTTTGCEVNAVLSDCSTIHVECAAEHVNTAAVTA